MSSRVFYTLGFLLVCFLLGVSIYLQVVNGIQPCPLCTLQRFAFGFMAIVLLSAIFFNRSYVSRMIHNTLLLFFTLIGGLLAGRQVWLQNYPSEGANECGVSLQYMLQALPFDQAMAKVFQGSAECTQRGWEFLHFNMAEWALLWFIFFFLFSLFLYLREMRWHTS